MNSLASGISRDCQRGRNPIIQPFVFTKLFKMKKTGPTGRGRGASKMCKYIDRQLLADIWM